jgi:autotransporter-associated beta strand protein
MAAAMAMSLASTLHAADGTWTNDVDGNWTDVGNWSGAIADGVGFTAYFTAELATANRTVTLNGNRTIGNITFTDGTTSSHDLTLSGANTLTLDVSSGAPTVNVTQADRTLTIGSVVAGSDGLTKSGSGTLALSAANSYSGTNTLSSGTLQLGNATSMGLSTLTMASGTALQLRNDSDTTFTAPINTAPTTGVTYNFDVNNAGSAVTGKKLSLSNLTFATSTTTITNTINVTGGNGYTLGLGTVSTPSGGPGGPHPLVIKATTAAVAITKVSTGSYGTALVLQGGNAITLTTFEMGANGNNSLTVSGSGTVATLGTTTQANNRAGGAAAYTLTSGTLNLTTTTSLANIRAANGALIAPTFAINGGTLNNTSGSALTLAASPSPGTIAGSPAITLGGNFSFGTSGSTSTNDLNLGAGGILNAGNRTITFAGTGTTLTLSGTMTNGGVLDQTTTVNGAGNTLTLGGYSLGSTGTKVINGTGNVNITGALTENAVNNLIYSGTGTLRLSGLNTFTGKTTVSGGTLEISPSGTLYGKSGVGAAYVVQVDAGATLKLAAWNYGATGGIGNSWFGTTTLLVNGGTITYANNGAAEGVVDNSGRPMTIGVGGAILNAAGSALWTITPNSAGGYQNQDITNGLTLTGSGNGVHQKNLTGTAGTLTKSGSGTWTLSGTNTYTGATTINAGKLALGANNTLDADNNVVLAGGTLDIGAYSNVLGALTVTDDSTIALGAGTGTLSFASVAGWTAGKRLALTGTLGETTLKLAILTPEQLASMSCHGMAVTQNASGYIKAVRGTLILLM